MAISEKLKIYRKLNIDNPYLCSLLRIELSKQDILQEYGLSDFLHYSYWVNRLNILISALIISIRAADWLE